MGNYIDKYINFHYFKRDINILSWDFSKNITKEIINSLHQKHNIKKNNSWINAYQLKENPLSMSYYLKETEYNIFMRKHFNRTLIINSFL